MGEPDFRTLFENAPGCSLVLAPDLTIVAVSNEYLRVTMTKRADLLGRYVFDAFPEDPSEGGSTAVDTARASFERVLEEKRPHAVPFRRYPIRRPVSEGGQFEERFWALTNVPVIGPGGQVEHIIHSVQDVTEVVRLQNDRDALGASVDVLTLQAARYAHLLDTAPDAVVIVADDGRIQLVNKQTESLFGYTREELLGVPLEVLIPERYPRGHDLHIKRFFTSPVARPMGSGLELFKRRKDGSEVPIEVSLSPQTTLQGATVSAAIRDITERRRLEAAAKVSSGRLVSAVESIQDAFALFDAHDRLLLCTSAY